MSSLHLDLGPWTCEASTLQTEAPAHLMSLLNTLFWYFAVVLNGLIQWLWNLKEWQKSAVKAQAVFIDWVSESMLGAWYCNSNLGRSTLSLRGTKGKCTEERETWIGGAPWGQMHTDTCIETGGCREDTDTVVTWSPSFSLPRSPCSLSAWVLWLHENKIRCFNKPGNQEKGKARGIWAKKTAPVKVNDEITGTEWSGGTAHYTTTTSRH